MGSTDEVDIKVVRATNGYTVRVGRAAPVLYIAKSSAEVLAIIEQGVESLVPAGA